MAKKAKQTTWSQEIAQVKGLLADIGENLLVITRKLVCVYEDAEFRAHCEEKKENPEDFLSDLLQPHFGHSFQDLRAALLHCDDPERWKTSVVELIVEGQRARQSKSVDPEPSPKRTTVAELRQELKLLKAEYDDVVKERDFLRERVARLEDQLEQLKSRQLVAS